MELTYTVRGADGKEYGSVTLDQLTAWINEGRLNAQQAVKRSDMQDWATAGTFGELQNMFVPMAAPSGVPPAMRASAPTPNPAAAIHMKSGASWFYWIAGLSLINSIVSLTGSQFGFALGLGITQVFDAIGSQNGGAGKAVVLILDLLVCGLFIMFGVFAHKAHTWAFIAGMVLFALDGAIALIASAWISVALHGLALFYLFRGMQACRELNRAGA